MFVKHNIWPGIYWPADLEEEGEDHEALRDVRGLRGRAVLQVVADVHRRVRLFGL